MLDYSILWYFIDLMMLSDLINYHMKKEISEMFGQFPLDLMLVRILLFTQKN